MIEFLFKLGIAVLLLAVIVLILAVIISFLVHGKKALSVLRDAKEESDDAEDDPEGDGEVRR